MKRWLTVVCMAVLVVGCSGDDSTEVVALDQVEATTPTTTGPTATIEPTTTVPGEVSTVADESTPSTVGSGSTATGCGFSIESGVTEVEFSSGGIARTYRRFVPSGYDGSTEVPVVLNFHGLTGSAGGQALSTRLEDVAERETFIAIHPQGTRNSNGMTFFEFGLGSEVDDVGFAADILDEATAELCVDETRLYSMGHSNGGYMSSRLACEFADRLAAVATVSATIHPDDCQPKTAIPLLSFHGTADDVVPFDGGPSVFLGGQSASDFDDPPASIAGLVELFAMEIPDEVGEWADSNGCDGQTASTGEVDGETVISYVGCDAPVEFHVIEGGDHSWPGAGGASGPDATELAWKFFSQHAR